MQLDIELARRNFPAFDLPEMADRSFFENAGGSFPCRHTVDALDRYYRETKVQPYGPYEMSERAGAAMDRSYARWAEALGVAAEEVSFGPSTSMNTYVLAAAFAEILSPGDEVIVTNQDHEANTGAVRRMAASVGCTLHEWRIDPVDGSLDLDGLAALLGPRTRLVCLPQCSNIVGQENDVAAAAALAHEVGARVVVDAVSFAPHAICDVGALDADVYLFSLYKVYSVHQGLMVVRNGLLDDLPNQGHYFNAADPRKRLTPAGPDHAQVAAAGAVLDYVEDLHADLGGEPGDLRHAVAAAVSVAWQDHETALLVPVLDHLAASPAVRLLGPSTVDGAGHRCPTVAFSPREVEPQEVVAALAEQGVMAAAGSFYAPRVLEALDVDPERGVVRVSWVHYTSPADIERLLDALDDLLGG